LNPCAPRSYWRGCRKRWAIRCSCAPAAAWNPRHGRGDVLIEVLKDVAFRKAPVSEAEELRMLDKLNGRAVTDDRGPPKWMAYIRI
jgi:hypothetical protein